MALIYLYESTETDFRYNGKPLPKAVVDVQWGLNDEFYAMGRYPVDEDEVYNEIVEDRIVKVHTFHGMEPMRIVDVQDRDLYVEFEAWPLFFADMRNKMVKPLNLRNATGQTALNAFFNNLLIKPRFNFYSNITETHDYHTQDVDERENNPNQLYDALEVFSAIVRRWNGEISIRGYDIRMNDRIGTDTEALLYEKKNITEFLDGTNIKNIVTRAHGKAEWTEEGPDGEQIDRSIQATVDSPLINAYSGIIFERQYTNNDVRSEKELKDWLRLKFSTENLDKPTRSIEVSTNMIDGTSVGPADTLILKYIKHDVDMRIKIVGYEYDGFANKLKRFILGEPKATVSNTIGNTITETINNVVRPIAQTAIRAQQSADGKRTKYSGTQDPNTLNLNANKGDEYWRDIGDETIIYEFNGTTWDIIIDTSETTKNAKAIAEQQKEIEEVKQTADEAVDRINTDIAGKFTALDEEILAIEGISNSAQANAQTALTQSIDALGDASLALTNAQTAINTAGSAISSIQDINVEIDEINGTLAVKADSSTVNAIDGTVNNLSTEVGIIAGELSLKANSSAVDTLTGRVSTAESGITANANAINLKANQSTVDTLAGTVSSLGSDIGVVAGQITSKVWNTDIQTAVDGIEVGGRNLIKDSQHVWTSPNNVGLGIPTLMSDENEPYYTVVATGNRVSTYGFDGDSNASIFSQSMVEGDVYTVSVDVRVPVEGLVGFYASRGMQNVTRENEWTRIHFSYVYREGYRVLGLSYNSSNNIDYRNWKIEKGNKATDWTPAPEDTTALINHVETELTQKYDSITASVSSVDGRVAQQKITLDSIVSTVSDIQEDAKGTTTLLNQTVSTVNTQSSTLATIRTDLDGKATITQFNILTSTVNGTIQRVGNAEGKITQIETNISGIQTTVASKASQSQVTQLDNAYNIFVGGIKDRKNLLPGMERGAISSFSGDEYSISGYIRSPYIPVEPYSYYIASLDGSPVSFAIYRYSDIGQFVDNTSQNTSYKSVGGNVKYIRVVMNNSNPDLKYQLEKGFMVTDYVPFISDVSSTQISMLQDNINLRVTSTELNNAIGGKADKNQLITQINLSPDTALIQSKNILLDGDVTVRGTAWMDGAVLKNLSVDGAKIQDETVGSSKIANLDVSKISGNRSDFVSTHWNTAVGGNVRITGSGILTTASDNSQTYIQDGIVGTRNPSGATIGQLGYANFGGSPVYTMSTSWGSHFRIMQTREYTNGTDTFNRESFYLQAGGWDGRIATNRFEFDGNAGVHFYNQPVMYTDLSMNGQTIKNPYGIDLINGGYLRTISSGQTRLSSSGSLLQLGVSSSWKFQMDSTRNYMFQPLSMEGHNITNSPSISDSRLKDVYGIRTEEDLDKLLKIQYVNFRWREEELGGDDLGFVAQQVQNIVPEIMMDVAGGYLGYNRDSYLNFIGHSVQQLALRELNTNKVASQALQLGESNKSEIDELREENRDLRNRIEELESAA